MPYNLILLPGFTGTGKTDHIIKYICESLTQQGRSTACFDMTTSGREGLGGFKGVVKKNTIPSVIILDDTMLLSPQSNGTFLQCVQQCLSRKDCKVVIIGGGFSTTKIQALLLEDLVSRLKNASTMTIPVCAKPLNLIQSVEILTEGSERLTLRERILFASFVLARVPPFLRTLCKFRLRGDEQTLPEALASFTVKFQDEEFLVGTLKRARIFPVGWESDQPLPSDLRTCCRTVGHEAQRLVAG